MMITKPFQWCWDTLPRRILSKNSLPWQFDNGENRSIRLRTHINPYYRYTIKLYSASRWVATGNIKDLPTFATFQNIVLRQRYALCHHSYLRSHFSRRHATLDRDRNDNLKALDKRWHLSQKWFMLRRKKFACQYFWRWQKENMLNQLRFYVVRWITAGDCKPKPMHLYICVNVIFCAPRKTNNFLMR